MIEVGFFVGAFLLGAYLLAPAFQSRRLPEAEARHALLSAAQSALCALEDLDLDWHTGKLSEFDYRTERAALEAEAAENFRRLPASGEGQ